MSDVKVGYLLNGNHDYTGENNFEKEPTFEGMPVTSVVPILDGIAGTHTVKDTEQIILVHTAGGPPIVLLPNSTVHGRIFTIKDRDGNASGANVTIRSVSGTVYIDNTTSKVINTDYGYMTVVFNGTQYFIISK